MAQEADLASLMVLYVCQECFVYRLPPRTRSGGYRAEEWGLDQPMWTGQLRILSAEERCIIRLEDTATGELFAAGPYTPEGHAVEAALDSSRYFALRVENAGQHAFIGIGFRERNDAFDFTATLQAHDRYVKALKEGPVPQNDTVKVDRRLKDGETIHMSVKGFRDTPARSASTTEQASTVLRTLPPPPPPGPRSTCTIQAQQLVKEDDEDDEFGDFVSG